MPRGRPRSKFQSEPVICPHCKKPVGITLKVEKRIKTNTRSKKDLKKK